MRRNFNDFGFPTFSCAKGGTIGWKNENIGYEDSTFEKTIDAVKALRKIGFQNAMYRKNLHGGNKITKRIRNEFENGFIILQHSITKNIAFVGYHKDDQGAKKTLWLRIIGKNEIKNPNDPIIRHNHAVNMKDLRRGAGISDYLFNSVEDAVIALQIAGFQRADASEICKGHEFIQKIFKIFNPGCLAFQNINGTPAFVGYHYRKTQYGKEKVLWVRIIGQNELKFFEK